VALLPLVKIVVGVESDDLVPAPARRAVRACRSGRCFGNPEPFGGRAGEIALELARRAAPKASVP